MRQLCKGNVAIVKGAILAGCRAYYGYPVFKDKKHDPVENAVVPQRPVPDVLEITAKETGPIAELPKHQHHFKEFKIKIAGFGGQGVLLLGQLLTEMGMREGLEVS